MVAVVGVDAVRHVTAPRELALAALPIAFGVHQITEAFVWYGLEGRVGQSVADAALWVYLAFALVALPAFVPLAVGLIEPLVARRRIIGAFGILGLGVAAILAAAMLREPVTAAIADRHIEYSVEGLHSGGTITALYVVATCGAFLASSYRDIARLGALNFVAIPILMALTTSGFVSLWCFWAAIVSVLIALNFRHQSIRNRTLRGQFSSYRRAVLANHRKES